MMISSYVFQRKVNAISERHLPSCSASISPKSIAVSKAAASAVQSPPVPASRTASGMRQTLKSASG